MQIPGRHSDTRLWHPFAAMGEVRSHEFVVTRAQDVWVWDADGRRYLDATASLWYANIGHGRREVIDAIADQFRQLDAYSTFGDFANRPALDLAGRLPELVHLISRTGGYHGTHGFGTSIGGIPANRLGRGPLIDHSSAVRHDSLEA